MKLPKSGDALRLPSGLHKLQSPNQRHSFQLLNGTTRGIERYEVRSGETWKDGRERVEMRDVRDLAYGKPYWFMGGLVIEPYSPTRDTVIFQIKGVDGPRHKPWVSLRIVPPGRLELKRVHYTGEKDRKPTIHDYDLGPVAFGKRYDYVLMAEAGTGTGRVKLILNGQAVVDFVGDVGDMGAANAGYAKRGVYTSASDTDTRIVEHHDYRFSLTDPV